MLPSLFLGFKLVNLRLCLASTCLSPGFTLTTRHTLFPLLLSPLLLLVSLSHFSFFHVNGLPSPLLVLPGCLTPSHGYHHLPENDLLGGPEPVQLRGGGEPGGHQSTFGQVQGCGQPQ